MKFSRRSFLRALPAASISAKVAADKAVAEAAGVMPFGRIPTASPIGGGGIPNVGSSSGLIEEKPWMKALRFFRGNGLPDWKLRNLRDEARSVYALDPDIAAKKSWSMSVKIQEQRERNFQRLCEQSKRNIVEWGQREEFGEQNGFWL
jgi:hypothetical protein